MSNKNNAVFEMLNMKRRFCNPDIDCIPKKRIGVPLKRVKGSLYRAANGQLYGRLSSGTLLRVNPDGTRQFRRGK